jgi:hypothetical protein
VARASYIDSRLVDLYMAGETISVPEDQYGQRAKDGALCIQGPIERAVIDLLSGRDARQSAAA